MIGKYFHVGCAFDFSSVVLRPWLLQCGVVVVAVRLSIRCRRPVSVCNRRSLWKVRPNIARNSSGYSRDKPADRWKKCTENDVRTCSGGGRNEWMCLTNVRSVPANDKSSSTNGQQWNWSKFQFTYGFFFLILISIRAISLLSHPRVHISDCLQRFQ